MRGIGTRLSTFLLAVSVIATMSCSRSRDSNAGRTTDTTDTRGVWSAGGNGGSTASGGRGATQTGPASASGGRGGSGVLTVGTAPASMPTAGAQSEADRGTAAAGCPPYQALCNGSCIVTSQDPQNCGACGRACAAEEACSAGVCAATCSTPPTGGNTRIAKCGQQCVDLFNDNTHCGDCDMDCTAASQVCVGGRCTRDTLGLDPKGKACPNGGPTIFIDDGTKKSCAGKIAQTTFRWGMCSCGDVSVVNSGESWPGRPGLNVPALYIDAYDSSKGPWDMDKPELGGSLGLNGSFASESGAYTFITGNMWTAGSIRTGGPMDVKQELHALGAISAQGEVHVGQPNSSMPPPTVPVVPGTASWDGFVAGNIDSAAPIMFHKDLYHQAANAPANVVVTGASNSEAVSFAPPCDACGDAQLPVAAFVDHYAATGTDNAAIGLDPGALSNLSDSTRLDLPCGAYYLDSIQSEGSVTVFAHGHTALFIGGDVSAETLSFTLAPDASFDVFVKGNIETQSDLIIGNPNYAALSRTYVSGAGFSLNGEAHIAGLFYAANSDIELQSHLTVYGALYCKSFNGTGDNTDIHYDRAALQLDKDCCENPEIPDAPGCNPPGCTSCKDCGNQSCTGGTCGPCTSDADCCAPLLCVDGVCEIPLE
jgi:hypothetical protein